MMSFGSNFWKSLGITLKVGKVQLCPWTKKRLRLPSLQNVEDGKLRKNYE